MITTKYHCDRCGGEIPKDAFMAFVCAELYGLRHDEPDHFEYRLCAPCYYGYRNTFKHREGE